LTDHNGSVDREEWQELCKKMGNEEAMFSEAERDALFDEVDTDKNGTISFHEFVDFCLDKEMPDAEMPGAGSSVAKWAMAEGTHEIHTAVVQNDLDTVRRCLDTGTSVNISDIQHVTPLHWACRRGYQPAAEMLLKAKADVHLKTDLGRTPLHAAAETGSVELLQLLLDHGASVNETDVRDQTPLHWAVRSSKEEAASFLLDNSAFIHAKTVGGYTPYAMAQDWSTYGMAVLLEKRGGDRG